MKATLTFRNAFFICKNSNLNNQVPDLSIKRLLCYEANIKENNLPWKWDNNIVIDLPSLLRKFDLLKSGTPLVRITGRCWFYNVQLDIWPYVFAPRPETEELVEQTIKIIKQKWPDQKITIFEFGSGSGAISIALKQELKTKAEIYSIEKCHHCFLNACANSKKLKLDINFVHAQTMRAFLKLRKRCHVFISNPPYVSEQYDDQLFRQVLLYETPTALLSGDQGLYFYWVFLSTCPKLLVKDGVLACEFGINQKPKIMNLIKAFKEYQNKKITWKQDAHQKWRMFFIHNED